MSNEVRVGQAKKTGRQKMTRNVESTLPPVDWQLDVEAIRRTELCYLILIFVYSLLMQLSNYTHPYVIHCLRSYNPLM